VKPTPEAALHVPVRDPDHQASHAKYSDEHQPVHSGLEPQHADESTSHAGQQGNGRGRWSRGSHPLGGMTGGGGTLGASRPLPPVYAPNAVGMSATRDRVAPGGGVAPGDRHSRAAVSLEAAAARRFLRDIRHRTRRVSGSGTGTAGQAYRRRVSWLIERNPSSTECTVRCCRRWSPVLREQDVSAKLVLGWPSVATRWALLAPFQNPVAVEILLLLDATYEVEAHSQSTIIGVPF
jgi:hypothetical protein